MNLSHCSGILAVCLSLVLGCVQTTPTSSRPKETIRLDETIRNSAAIRVTGHNDPLEASVKVDTYEYCRPRFLLRDSHDWFFRGFYHKKLKEATYQLYVIFNSRTWIFWDLARFNSPSGLSRREVKRVGSDVKCGRYGCDHYEDVIMELDRSTLERWGKEGAVVRFASSRVDATQDIHVDAQEATDFLKKMDGVLAGGI